MLLKKIIASSLLALGVSAAHAQDLTITNNTDFPSTTHLNNTICSSVLGDLGVTPAKGSRTINEQAIRLVCITNPNNCQADVYLSKDCSGPVIAKAVYDVATGLKSVSMISPDYQIEGSPFNLVIKKKSA